MVPKSLLTCSSNQSLASVRLPQMVEGRPWERPLLLTVTWGACQGPSRALRQECRLEDAQQDRGFQVVTENTGACSPTMNHTASDIQKHSRGRGRNASAGTVRADPGTELPWCRRAVSRSAVCTGAAPWEAGAGHSGEQTFRGPGTCRWRSRCRHPTPASGRGTPWCSPAASHSGRPAGTAFG